jgi:hypothetical protein
MQGMEVLELGEVEREAEEDEAFLLFWGGG